MRPFGLIEGTHRTQPIGFMTASTLTEGRRSGQAEVPAISPAGTTMLGYWDGGQSALAPPEQEVVSCGQSGRGGSYHWQSRS
jgi:hypothetical protein